MVELKSYRNGLVIKTSPEGSFESVMEEVAAKFRDNAGFFGEEQIAVSFAGRELSLDEEFELVRVIEDNSRLRIRCVAGLDDERIAVFDRALERADYERMRDSFLTADIRHKSVICGEKVTSDRSLVVLGDVEKGASIVTDGDLYCFGALMGYVSAGNDMQKDHKVVALTFSPEHLDISGIIYRPGKETGLGFGFGKQKGGKIARAGIGDRIIVSPMTRQMFDTLGEAD